LRFLCRRPGWAIVAAVGAWAGLLACPPSAWAGTVEVNALARVAYVGTTSSGLQWAGTVTDPALGGGGLLASLGRTAGGYAGSATIVNSSGSLTGTVRATLRRQVNLVHFDITADITIATGRFAGARGTLTGTALVTATLAVGSLRLHGTLHGAAGRLPAGPPGTVVRHVDGRFRGAELSVAHSGEETVVGSATGIVPGPAVVVVRDRATLTTVRGTFTVFVAGGSLAGVIDVRLRGRSAVRSESGTATITGGAGDLSGARSTSAAAVSGTRDLVTQLIALRIRGAFTP
jgi:hypothetical protein